MKEIQVVDLVWSLSIYSQLYYDKPNTTHYRMIQYYAAIHN